jgi:hypothetical protein
VPGLLIQESRHQTLSEKLGGIVSTEKDSLELLLEEGKVDKLEIAGRTFYVGKFKGLQHLRFIKFFVKLGVRYADKLKNFKSQETDMQDLLGLVDIITEEDLLQLIAICLFIDDLKFCEEVDGENLLDIFKAVCKHNNIGVLLKKAKEMLKELRSQLDTTQTSS